MSGPSYRCFPVPHISVQDGVANPISSPWDNAVTESLAGCIKSECVHARTFDSREQAVLEIFDYIEGFYNPARIHSALGWLSPDEFEKANWKGRTQAA